MSKSRLLVSSLPASSVPAKRPAVRCILATVSLTSTIYNFDIDLADADRGCYESLALRVARHPSESEEYLVTRVLAYCLECAEGISFSSGISDPDEPTLSIRDLTGTIHTWIEIGSPEAARLHKASKAAGRVVVYTHKDPGQLLRQWSGHRIHRAELIEVYSFDRAFVTALAGRLHRRLGLTVSVSDDHVFVALSDATFESPRTRHVIEA
jgi:uncharacterized protein YaeQ